MSIAARGISFAELDERSYEQDSPYAIITADCSNPHEIDDGIAVQPLPSASEAYRVTVCVADARTVYRNTELFGSAMKHKKSQYFSLDDGEPAYEPMLPESVVRGKEFISGVARSALMVSFVVGEDLPPTDIGIGFGQVEVTTNYDYRDFSLLSDPSKALEKYARVARFIQQGIRYNPGGDASARHHTTGAEQQRFSRWTSGSRINEAFMVAANHLVGRTLHEEALPAIYRVHNLSDQTYDELLEPNVAVYSQTPGVHEGLGIDDYCRVTSPLRRLEDLVMHHHLGLRAAGERPRKSDVNVMRVAIRALNKQTIWEQVTRERSRPYLVRPPQEDSIELAG